MTKEWAVSDFNLMREWAANYAAGRYGYGEASKKYYRLPHHVVNSYGVVDTHIKLLVKAAEKHYDESINKLAYRIEQKGLNIDKIYVQTSHIGVNINTILTDGEKTVKAFTIIASGDIQRPHYRYLIK